MGISSWAGLWFGLTIPVIVLMYLFKRKYLDTVVPSHLLWNQVLRNIEANRPWQKLQNRLLLWLQLLVAALLVFALMLPFVWVHGSTQGHTVIIVDTSASMSARWNDATSPGKHDKLENRLHGLKEQLIQYADSLERGNEVTLVKLGSEPEVLLSRETNGKSLRKVIESLSVDYGKAAYRETLSLAAALTQDDPKANVILYTDGQWNESSADIVFDVPVEVVSLNDRKGTAINVGVEQFGVKNEESSTEGLGVAVVRNYGTSPIEVTLDLYSDGKLAASKQTVLEGGKRTTVSFDGLPIGDVYKLKLSPEDDYAPDNEVFAFREQGGVPNVLLLSAGNLFLEKALQLSGARVTLMDLDSEHASVGQTDNTETRKLPTQSPDIVIVDGETPAFLKEDEWALLLRETPLWTLGGEGERVQPSSGEMKVESHPVIRYLSLTEPPAGEIQKETVPTWAKPILKMDGLPVMYAGMESGVPRLRFLFSLTEGDLPLRPEFPILVNNAVQWLQSGRMTGLGRVTAGKIIDVPVTASAVDASWVPKDGYAVSLGASSIPVQRVGQNIASQQETPAIPGLWKFEMRDESGAVLPGFNVEVAADSMESVIYESEPLPLNSADGTQQVVNGNSEVGDKLQGDIQPSKSRLSLVYLAAWLALIVILAEWGVYQRGRSI
ncbi:vWA domain-containing protein [Paenibacillus sp. FSL K6-2524]|uniref:vWA domain-containing protein n=1 Tax=Paenibacillus sp. FSL K6-2524 TaxID=2954516 RepID=UPI0030F77C3B